MRRVVVIDDSAFIRKQLVSFFEQRTDFEVVATGADGNDAVALFRRHQPDLITLDLSMPNKTGMDAVKEIIDEFPDANILIVSAVRSGVTLNCMAIGAKDFVEKPLKLSDPEFIESFEAALEDAFED